MCACAHVGVRTRSRMIPKFLLVPFTQIENSEWEGLVGVGISGWGSERVRSNFLLWYLWKSYEIQLTRRQLYIWDWRFEDRSMNLGIINRHVLKATEWMRSSKEGVDGGGRSPENSNYSGNKEMTPAISTWHSSPSHECQEHASKKGAIEEWKTKRKGKGKKGEERKRRSIHQRRQLYGKDP